MDPLWESDVNQRSGMKDEAWAQGTRWPIAGWVHAAGSKSNGCGPERWQAQIKENRENSIQRCRYVHLQQRVTHTWCLYWALWSHIWNTKCYMCRWMWLCFLTVELWSETESVVALVLLVPVAIVTHSGWGVLAAALVPGMRDGVLNRAILQPASVAPVQSLQPGLCKDTMWVSGPGSMIRHY